MCLTVLFPDLSQALPTNQSGLLMDQAPPTRICNRLNSVDTNYSNINESFMDNTKMHVHDLDHDMTNFSQASSSSQSTMLSSPLSHNESARTPPSLIPNGPAEHLKSLDIM